MAKLIGYTEMKNKHGKILHCAREVAWGVGLIPYDKPIFLYDAEADAITADDIGKEITINRGVSVGK